MTIHLPEDLESSIRAEVLSGHFASVDDAITEAVRSFLQRRHQTQAAAPEPNTSQGADPLGKPIWERILEMTAEVPEEEWDKLPVDSSEQLDHYVYGTPKRPTT
jgi:Arc/MetJ-type ribon-helix-helix transcriptional regulator